MKKAISMRLKLFLFLYAIFGLFSSTALADHEDRQSCYCKVETAGHLTPVRQAHFSNVEKCQEHLVEVGKLDFWENICKEDSASYAIKCGRHTLEGVSGCHKITEYHQYLTFNEEVEIKAPTSVFEFHNSAKFNYRQTFSYLAHFMSKNSGLDLSNSLYGGIYEESTNYRIDLTIIDFYFQLEEAFNNKKFSAQYKKLQSISAKDPIKTFNKLFTWLDAEIKNNRKVRKVVNRLFPIIYTGDAFAIQPAKSILSAARLFNPRKDKDIKIYNEVIQSKNRTAIFKELKTKYFPEIRTPITVQLISTLDRKHLKKDILNTHWRIHLEKVAQLNNSNSSYQFNFEMNGNGDSILLSATSDSEGKSLKREVIDIYNYIQSSLNPNSLKELFQDRPKHNISLAAITPLVVRDNYDFWEEIVQEDSWSRHITQGNDQVLLILRSWMKKNHEEVISKLHSIEMDQELEQELKLWNSNKRPKRGLTLDLYPALSKVYPDRPWEKEFVLNARGEKEVLGEKKFKKSLRNIFGRLKKIGSIENIASAATATGVMSLTANAYLSATTSTLIHDFITAKRYGYEVRPYMVENTPGNLLSALIFSTGFTPGRTADAIFRGAATGAFQSAITGSSIKLGMVVGGLSGGLLQQLPPEVSNWVVSGENKDTLNIFSELAEQAFFKGLNGAIVGYYEDGDWQKGLKRGAAFGTGYAAFKIVVFGVRYDANAYISDEEIAEYNHLHNHECGHFAGEYLERDTSVMADRYGTELNITRDDVKRAQFRKDGLLMKGRPDSTLGTNFSGPFGSEIGIAEGSLTREETLLHEVMHTRQMQQGRMLNLINRLGPNSVPEGFWEEYVNVGEATLPTGYYRTFIYTNFEGDLN